MHIKAIILDFDGVVHNTFDFHRKKIAEFSGVLLSENDFRKIHNGNFFKNENKQLKDIDWLAYRDFIYESQCKLRTEDSIKDTLLKLGKIVDLFIVSSGGKENIFDYLRNNNIAEVFKEVLGLESHRSKIDKFIYLFQKYSLNSDNCIFVTDTLGDILEANKLNIRTIAVDYGFHPKETLNMGKPCEIISDLSEILNKSYIRKPNFPQ